MTVWLRLCLLWIVLFAHPALARAPTYQYVRIGNPLDAHVATSAGFALIGGGGDLDPAFQWLCAHAKGGDVLVLRARGTDAYNSYIQDLCHANSVATLVIPDRASARDPFVLTAVRQAEAIFIAGGDQANYINFWKGTPLQRALNEAMARHVPIGGTSAGLAIQGEFIYSAQGDAPDDPDLQSKDVLTDPYNRRVTLVRGFLRNPLLASTLTDSHFAARDRMGRTLTFMARLLQQGPARTLRAIAIDEQTAVLVEADGSAKIVGHGRAYFLQASKPPQACAPHRPLTFQNVSVRSLADGDTFNVKDWSATGGAAYSLSVVDGVIQSTLPGNAIYVQATAPSQ